MWSKMRKNSPIKVAHGTLNRVPSGHKYVHQEQQILSGPYSRCRGEACCQEKISVWREHQLGSHSMKRMTNEEISLVPW